VIAMRAVVAMAFTVAAAYVPAECLAQTAAAPASADTWQ